LSEAGARGSYSPSTVDKYEFKLSGINCSQYTKNCNVGVDWEDVPEESCPFHDYIADVESIEHPCPLSLH
jgi:hypothetical protein